MGEITLLMIGMGPTLKGMFVHRIISENCALPRTYFGPQMKRSSDDQR